MSSFRRKEATARTSTGALAVPVRRQLSGTKPFLNGQTLVSSGLSELDALLGGGLTLGTVSLLETPHDAGAASVALVDDLHRYFVAEGVAAGQCTFVASEDPAGFVEHQLPLELSLAQKQVKQQLASLQVPSKSNSADANADVNATPDAAANLKIAWQYEKYLGPGQTQQQTRFCHSFDLSRSMHQDMLKANAPVTFALEQCAGSDGPYKLLLDAIRAVVAERQATQVVRVCIRDLGSSLWFSAATPRQAHADLLRFLRQLRAIVSGTPVVCTISGPFYMLPSTVCNEMRHLCDYVMELKSFTGENDMLPAELSEFHGLFHFRKLARVHSLACHSTDAVKFGIKRERRKLKVEKLHLPPEGSRSTSAAGADQSGKKSSAKTAQSSKVGCGNGAGGFDPLAF
ncbi:TPA: hypothetical protein N0F65_005492 [Lagenidium giganteum]|uniref:Elongator complex protein 4 n=1 Tax=Lagenidium giganteum TaxID=4803 RepID=A0AAV2YKC3_9STRA|nr:TPA: hypothetical protein N0F65_005492 [Lagenidium giganteum]